MLIKLIIVIAAISTVCVTPSVAMDKSGCGGECMSCHHLTEKEAAELLKNLGATVKSVKPAPANGLFEILLEKEGKLGILFMDFGKKHIIQGAVAELPEFKQVSAYTQGSPNKLKVTSIDPETIPVANSIVMGNIKGTKHLHVFTDPDCPYCQKLHLELKALVKSDPEVAVHVMLYPLPMHPAAYEKSRVLLETKNQVLLDKAFEGKDLPKPVNESSKVMIDAIIKFANANGISGTPTLVMPDGRIEFGMRDVASLKKLLEVM